MPKKKKKLRTFNRSIQGGLSKKTSLYRNSWCLVFGYRRILDVRYTGGVRMSNIRTHPILPGLGSSSGIPMAVQDRAEYHVWIPLRHQRRWPTISGCRNVKHRACLLPRNIGHAERVVGIGGRPRAKRNQLFPNDILNRLLGLNITALSVLPARHPSSFIPHFYLARRSQRRPPLPTSSHDHGLRARIPTSLR